MREVLDILLDIFLSFEGLLHFCKRIAHFTNFALIQFGELHAFSPANIVGANLTSENVRAEVEYFRASGRQSFERTYGWAWLLKLCEELHSWDDADAKRELRAYDKAIREGTITLKRTTPPPGAVKKHTSGLFEKFRRK